MRTFLTVVGAILLLAGLIALIIFVSPAIVVFAWNVHLAALVPMLPQISYWATFWILWALGIVGGKIFGKTGLGNIITQIKDWRRKDE